MSGPNLTWEPWPNPPLKGAPDALLSPGLVILRATFPTNSVPHLVNDISGNPFQSPFASPPGEGLSPAIVKVLWDVSHLAVGYVLILRVGRFDLRRTVHVVAVGLGGLVMAVQLAHHFGKFHGGNL